jgi:putative NIF3 family GTP cyclohydrolase 1 type 2
VQTRSFAKLLASKLAEQNIHLDSAHLPADVSGADV